jgi:DNA-binding PadR family transcriptional regulator
VTTRSRSNPLALAVLCTLNEQPMHPYEISQTLRARAKHESIRLNFGSLYGVVAGLERRRLVRAVETVREGKRPERTVYDITEAGRREMYDWLSELIAAPVKEYLQFEAGLSLLGALPPDEAVVLLRQRCDAIEMSLEQAQAVHVAMEKRGLPRLFALESEYMVALQQAELEFTRLLVADIESAQLSGLDEWRQWHQSGPGSSPAERDRHEDERHNDERHDEDDERGDAR